MAVQVLQVASSQAFAINLFGPLNASATGALLAALGMPVASAEPPLLEYSDPADRLADATAQSPAESRLRVRLVLAGLPRPVGQHPVRVGGGRVLHPDLAWPRWRVAVEYAGLWHADVDQFHRDRRRLNMLVAAGWTVLHVTSRRMSADFPAVVTEIRTALFRAGWRS